MMRDKIKKAKKLARSEIAGNKRYLVQNVKTQELSVIESIPLDNNWNKDERRALKERC